MSFNPEITLQVDLAAAAIAIIALSVSVVVSRRQSRMALQDLRLQRHSDIIAWSKEALDHLCCAEMILRKEYISISSQAEFEKIRLQTMRDISSCIDQGRLFFPNLEPDGYGQHKPGASRGFRHPVLDCLMFTYRLLEKDARYVGVEAFEAHREKVSNFRSHFISGVQSELDPRGLARFLNKVPLGNKGNVAKSKSR
jgi:hypothetical protein